MENYNGGYLFSCVNKGNVVGKTYVGGVVSDIRAGTYIDSCYNTGNVTASGVIVSNNLTVCGGVVAESYGNISNCFSTGIVSGKANYVGGILGLASANITVYRVRGMADVYRDGVYVETAAWDKNLSGGLYGSITNVTNNNEHYYVSGDHSCPASWLGSEFEENSKNPGVPKLKWEK